MAVMRYLLAKKARWNRLHFRGSLSILFKIHINLYDIKNQVISTEEWIVQES